MNKNIKPCSTCGENPQMQTDEFGITYRLTCENCYKYTHDLISPSSTLEEPYCDDVTFSRLINEWNSLN